MNKSEFIDRLAQKGYTKKSASEIVDDVIQTISEVLVEGEKFEQQPKAEATFINEEREVIAQYPGVVELD